MHQLQAVSGNKSSPAWEPARNRLSLSAYIVAIERNARYRSWVSIGASLSQRHVLPLTSWVIVHPNLSIILDVCQLADYSVHGSSFHCGLGSAPVTRSQLTVWSTGISNYEGNRTLQR